MAPFEEFDPRKDEEGSFLVFELPRNGAAAVVQLADRYAQEWKSNPDDVIAGYRLAIAESMVDAYHHGHFAVSSEEVFEKLYPIYDGVVNLVSFNQAWSEITQSLISQSQALSPESKAEISPEAAMDIVRKMGQRDFVTVFQAERHKVIKLELMENETFWERAEGEDLQKRIYVLNLDTVLEMAAANPWAVRVEINHDFHEQEQLRKARVEKLLHQFDQMRTGDSVVVNGVKYVKLQGERFMESSNQQGAMTNRVSIKLASEVRLKLAQSNESDKIEFMIHENDVPRVIEESPKELRRIHESLREMLPDLYPKLYGRPRRQIFAAIRRLLSDSNSVSQEDLLFYVERSQIQQGARGDCYLLAGINSIKRTDPEVYLEMLARTIKRGDRPGEWKVRFLGSEVEKLRAAAGDEQNGEWITVSQQQIEDWRSQGAQADPPDIILEIAYASYISRIKKGKAGETQRLDKHGDMAFEGGFGHRALHHLLGDSLVQKNIIADYEDHAEGSKSLIDNGYDDSAREFLTKFSGNPKRYIITANTPYALKAGKDEVDKSVKFITVNDRYLLYRRHAYSVVGYKDDIVSLENPHDTSKKLFMPLQDFLKGFSQLSYVELHSRHKRYQPGAEGTAPARRNVSLEALT